jgi:type I restriction enzyme M protein
MNMILHNSPTALIVQGNTLADPKFKDYDTLKAFDYVVANPPFSDKRWSTGLDPLHDPFHRFKPFGTPPARQGDYAYLLHIVGSLKSTGKGACILPHGVLFRGNAEADIRRALVRKGYIKGIIGLPANLFYGTGIPACIVVVDKEDALARKGIFMIDARGGFMKDGPKNRLRSMDIHKIVDVFNKRLEVPKYARMVPFAEIERNEFNLNLRRYIDSQTPEDLQDIAGHLQGDIPTTDIDALERYWAVCPQLRQTIFRESRPGYVELVIGKVAIRSTIYGHPEFASFIAGMSAYFAQWRQTNLQTLKALQAGCHPKHVIATLAEGLLAHYAGKPLVDRYDVYQHLMDYWAETMQDDCYLIADDGWKAETTRIIEKDKKGKEKDRGWTCDLVPKAIIVARYFAKEQAAIDQLIAELENVTARLGAMEEEYGGEDGALADLDKLKNVSVTSRLKEIESDSEAVGEAVVLSQWLKLKREEAQLKKRLREADAALDAGAHARYPTLTEAEIKTLVVDDKWSAGLDAAMHSEMDRTSQVLAQRVKELAIRYETPLPKISSRLAELEGNVNRHLQTMGFAGNYGAMEELLTGRSRLPGFSGEWQVKRLGNTAVLKARIGWQGLTTAEYRDSGEYFLVTGTDFKDGYIDWDNCHYVDYSRYKQDKYIQLQKHDVLVTKDGTIGKIALVTDLPSPATLNSGIFVIRPIEGAFNPEFFYYLLCSSLFTDFLVQLSAGSTINHLYQKDFVGFTYRTPPTTAEQIAIARILSDTDAEIAELDAKLAKTRQLRQGMMHELLTARSRVE